MMGGLDIRQPTRSIDNNANLYALDRLVTGALASATGKIRKRAI